MPTDDYIKRSDAINAACTDCYCCETIDEFEDTTCPEKHKFMSIPAADVEPVMHGRWVKMTGMMPPEFTGHYSCSECDWFCKKHSVRETEFDFCPGCGAKMDKEEA